METAAIPANLPATIAAELELRPVDVAAVMRLLDEGSTVPFIARYRKEATGSLDEVAIRAIQERGAYLRDLEDRRQTVLNSISEQGKLTTDLEAAIREARTKALLEDLYLPFRPKRRTRAIVAREQGLEPLAQRILAQPADGDPKAEAAKFVNAEKGVADAAAALQGARDIVAESIAEDATIRRGVREIWQHDAVLVCSKIEARAKQPTRFEAYYDYREPVAKIPSHRFLAVRRGEHEGVLKVHLEADETNVLPRIEGAAKIAPGSPFAGDLKAAIEDGYRRLLQPSIETELRVELKLRSDRMAVDVFAENVRNLLLAPPLGGRRVIGIDPGIRTGCKCVAVDETGRFLASTTIHPMRDEKKAKEGLARFLKEHVPFAVGVGNGTHGRETESFARRVVSELAHPPAEAPSEPLAPVVDLAAVPDAPAAPAPAASPAAPAPAAADTTSLFKDTIVVSVNEAGASVYSASDVARAEFPKLDVAVRGAVSIARRLQDPLAELVKIDPKAIGVGQYQHDVHAPLLTEKLDEVVESCVNHVGVELNTASAPLLARVAGIGPALAGRIVKHRDEHGAFKGRGQLLEVSGLGPKTYEQCAGFLRIRESEHPLDASAVHPERYELVERIARDLETPLKDLVGNASLAERVEVGRYIGGDVGKPTLLDIIDELRKPGRDPRRAFEPPRFREDVTKLEDLKPGMTLEGVVTNVTAFGAFVDVGVHQDGLVHVSQLANQFVRDPHEVVKVGDRLSVRVLEVDLERKRIALTAKKDVPRPEPTQATAHAAAHATAEPSRRPPRERTPVGAAAGHGNDGTGDRQRDGSARRGGRGRDGDRGRGGDRDRDRDRRDRREPDETPRPSMKTPPPRPLTPQDAQRQGRNNPLGDLLKGLFEQKSG